MRATKMNVAIRGRPPPEKAKARQGTAIPAGPDDRISKTPKTSVAGIDENFFSSVKRRLSRQAALR
jgi:hypothetical protein